MAHTLRSKSKYGRTRRQRKKQRRMRGGFSITESLSGLINKFKPETQDKACENAQKKATEICDAYAQSDQSAPSEQPDQSVLPPAQPDQSVLPPAQSDQSVLPPAQPLNIDSSTIPGGTQVPLTNNNEMMLDEDYDSDVDVGDGNVEQAAAVTNKSNAIIPSPAATPEGITGSNEMVDTGDYSGVKRPRYNGDGGAKKSKKKNKKRSQNHRKKLRSRKHKK